MLISARIDGEPVAGVAGLEVHLESCEGCRRWQEEAHRLARSSIQIVENGKRPTIGVGEAQGASVNRWLRLMLAWAAVLLLVWNLPGVFAASGDPGGVHLARHQSAFAVALAIAFLYVAWRPDRAYGLVPFSVTFTLALALTTVVDLLNGSASVGGESFHLLELAGLTVLWTLGARVGPGRRRRRGRPLSPVA